MTDLSLREKALVEAAERLLERIDHDGGVGPYRGGPAFVVEPFRQALRAYDPPKPKVPQIPAWDALTAEHREAIDAEGSRCGCHYSGRMAYYNFIRTLTSKEAE